MTRVPREVALQMIAASGQVVTVSEPDLIEDADGIPLAVAVYSFTAVLHVSPRLLGWTAAELGLDDEVRP